MPRGDGTGPKGQGPKTGKGQGRCNPKGAPSAPGDRRGMGSGSGGGQGQGKRRGGGQGGGQGRGGRS
jgi:hypothetical protein